VAYTSSRVGLGATLGITILKRGMKGEQVAYVQELLNIHGCSPKLVKDGVFGPLTEVAVKGFQGANRLPVNGIVDINVLMALESEKSKDIPKPKTTLPLPVVKPVTPPKISVPLKVVGTASRNLLVVGGVALAAIAVAVGLKKKKSLKAIAA
jgi:peptidoglycan hydrolase-like protein with peptidoglycan-binding domain